MLEAFEWTDSLYLEFLFSFVNIVKVRYATPDDKGIDYLAAFIPKFKALGKRGGKNGEVVFISEIYLP